jgi:hypothetical protein
MIIDQWKLKNAKCGRSLRNWQMAVLSAAVLDPGLARGGFTTKDTEATKFS